MAVDTLDHDRFAVKEILTAANFRCAEADVAADRLGDTSFFILELKLECIQIRSLCSPRMHVIYYLIKSDIT